MNWIIFILIIQVLHFAGTWKLYQKAGRKSWEAAIPVYNAVVLMDIIKRPKWWVILLFIPVINLILFPVIWVEIARSFRKFDTQDTWFAILSLGFYNFYLNYVAFDDLKYNANRSIKPPSKVGEWISSVTFAIVAATIVHTYVMQPFTIPTSSLEKSLLIGDFLFVSKFHYGAKVPVSPLALPMVHDSIPGTGLRSYIKGIELPYMRLPGFQKIKRNEIVVFNWPSDSLALMWGDTSGNFTYKPIDKRTNYVKRCVGIAGDSLEIKDGYIYINGERTVLPDRAKPQYNYKVKSTKNLTSEFLRTKYDVNPSEHGVSTEISFAIPKNKLKELNNINSDPKKGSIGVDQLSIYEETADEYLVETRIRTQNSNYIASVLTDYFKNLAINKKSIKTEAKYYQINLTEAEAEKLKKENFITFVERVNDTSNVFNKSIFPHSSQYTWNQDNFGPIYIPAKGDKVVLNKESLPFYERIISEYEKNDFEIKDNGDIFINGVLTNEYTFKQDYYWMMGDNRHGSLDARYWGYTPFDHVVGKPVFIWMSLDGNETAFYKKIRWERLFTTVGCDGEPKSYFIYFLIILAIYYIGKEVYKRKKK